MHADQVRRENLTLDVMEAARPDVDAYALQLLQSHPFRKADFFEVNDGGTRILPPLTKQLAETAPRWGAAIAGIVEKVASWFLASPSVEKGSVRLATPLSEINRSRGRKPSRKKSPSVLPRSAALPRRCKLCGKELGKGAPQLCDACLEAHQAEANEFIKEAGVRRLAALRAKGNDPAHTAEANTKRGAKVAREAAARAEWDRDNTGQYDPDLYARRIAPFINRQSVRAIRAATGLSLRTCSQIRKGERVPHARHWSRLLELAGHC
jgi:hypothetical protein